MSQDAPQSLSDELDTAKRLARAAGVEVMRYFRGAFQVHDKSGELGPVTTADQAANALIVEALAAAYPGDLVVAEESPHPERRNTRTWFVDPIDGTRQFIDGEPEFAVMIGLVVDGLPTLGVVHNPATGKLAWALRGGGAWMEQGGEAPARLRTSQRTATDDLRAVRSRSHPSHEVNRLCEAMNVTEVRNMGSLGLKLLEVAAGRAELYANYSGFSAQWDMAAPQIILEEAGGAASTATGAPISYGPGGLYLSDGVVATNGLIHGEVLAAAARLGLQTGRG